MSGNLGGVGKGDKPLIDPDESDQTVSRSPRICPIPLSLIHPAPELLNLSDRSRDDEESREAEDNRDAKPTSENPHGQVRRRRLISKPTWRRKFANLPYLFLFPHFTTVVQTRDEALMLTEASMGTLSLSLRY